MKVSTRLYVNLGRHLSYMDNENGWQWYLRVSSYVLSIDEF